MPLGRASVVFAGLVQCHAGGALLVQDVHAKWEAGSILVSARANQRRPGQLKEFPPIILLGINDHRQPATISRVDGLLAHVMRQPAVGVVGEDQRVKVCRVLNRLAHRAHIICGWCIEHVMVDAQQHVAAGHIPALDRRARRAQFERVATERPKLVRNIRRSAGAHFAALRDEHGHGRLGADAFNAPEVVLVEYRIPDDGNVPAGDGF